MLWALSLLMVNGSWLLFNLPRRSAMPLGLSKNTDIAEFDVVEIRHDSAVRIRIYFS